jgi:branched-chain amino acid transport system ATP-binding protein
MTEGLVVEDLRAGYGDIVAVWDASFTVAQGQIVAVVGRNGAGKTTTVKAVAGLLRPIRGAITLNGTEITDLSPPRRARLGLGTVLEGRRIFRPLSVNDNLKLGVRASSSRGSSAKTLDDIYRQFPLLAELRSTIAGTLSGGQQQILAIAQAMAASPSILLVDEPSAGLAPIMIDAVFAIFQEVASHGVGILVVEERTDYVAPMADAILVFEHGHIVESSARWSGNPSWKKGVEMPIVRPRSPRSNDRGSHQENY